MKITKKVTLVWQAPYVTDGLVAYWDGQWNVGGGIHDTSATVWKDLTGSHDIALVPNGGNVSWLKTGLRLEGDDLGIGSGFSMTDLIGKGNAFTVSYLVNFEQTNSGRRYTSIALQDFGFGFN